MSRLTEADLASNPSGKAFTHGFMTRIPSVRALTSGFTTRNPSVKKALAPQCCKQYTKLNALSQVDLTSNSSVKVLNPRLKHFKPDYKQYTEGRTVFANKTEKRPRLTNAVFHVSR